MRPEWVLTAAGFYIRDQNPAPALRHPLSEWSNPFSYVSITAPLRGPAPPTTVSRQIRSIFAVLVGEVIPLRELGTG